jgi:hypothetical protein
MVEITGEAIEDQARIAAALANLFGTDQQTSWLS